MRRTLSLALALAFPVLASAQESIRLNQLGFYPDGPKAAVVVGATGDDFAVVDAASGETVFRGALGAESEWEPSAERVRRADFSAFATPGTYVLRADGAGTSYPFEIAEAVIEPVAKGAIKGYYYQRMSTPLLPEHAGKWARAAGHPDDHVLIHPSAASDTRPAGTVIAASKGWYDAGDFNKYIVNSGITMGTLLSAYEDFPGKAAALDLNIPESGNDVPDLLDEILWNLRWMLAMQDPADGGVYAKLTAPQFEGMIMPAEAKSPRYVVQKSTPAALDFAAVTAQAARVFRGFEDTYPGLADSCLTASIAAWQWARRNPEVMYNQRAMNEQFDPDVTTGAYGDRRVTDEFAWAAAELYVTTEADSFLHAVDLFPDRRMILPGWPVVGTLAYYTLLRHADRLPPAVAPHVLEARARVLAYADSLVAAGRASAYGVTMNAPRDFVWGGTAVLANQGIVLVNAYLQSPRPEYLHYAIANMDYLVGRNATGYSFVTGFGDKPTMNPHHRQSEADGIVDPVPGLLSGGPNPGQQDGCDYPSKLPALSYVDATCSYASNEIAINWNAPLAYLSVAIEALMGDSE
ncbi:MAG TPA: glycoside hydrolase family 9 protein [Rhodothermales bacterium]